MANVVIVPLSELSNTARIAVIDEFITRDSSVWDGTLEEKRAQVLQALEAKQAVITFDSKRKTTDIRTVEQLNELPLSTD